MQSGNEEQRTRRELLDRLFWVYDEVMKTILYPAITLDGFIANLDGECYSWISEEDENYYNQAVEKAGCLLVGRKTYEQYIDDFSAKQAIAFVYTSRNDLKDQDKIKFLRGTPRQVISQIAHHGFKELIVGGGGELNGSLAMAGLIDEIVVSIYSVTLGEGIPLFGGHRPKLNLKLISSKQDVQGIVKNHYAVL